MKKLMLLALAGFLFMGCAPDKHTVVLKRMDAPKDAFVIEWNGTYYVMQEIQPLQGGVAGRDADGKIHHFWGDVHVIIDQKRIVRPPVENLEGDVNP